MSAPVESTRSPNLAPASHLLNAEDLAQRWQVPKTWVYSATRDGRIPAVRLGRYRRYRLVDIEAFEASGGVLTND